MPHKWSPSLWLRWSREYEIMFIIFSLHVHWQAKWKTFLCIYTWKQTLQWKWMAISAIDKHRKLKSASVYVNWMVNSFRSHHRNIIFSSQFLMISYWNKFHIYTNNLLMNNKNAKWMACTFSIINSLSSSQKCWKSIHDFYYLSISNLRKHLIDYKTWNTHKSYKLNAKMLALY